MSANRGKISKLLTSYFTTKTGRKVVRGGVCVTGIVLFGVNYFPHTFFVDYYKNIIQSYKSGIPQPIPEKIQNRIENALNIVEITEHERKYVYPFTIFGLDVFQIGTTKSRYGGFIGIPVNYSYNTVADINKSDIHVNNEPVKWNSPDGEMLATAIVLTEDEQLYGIARAILQIYNHKVILNSVYPTFTLFSMYALGNYLNHKFNLYMRPLGMRVTLYSFIGLFGYGIWAFLKDYTTVYYDTNADKRLSDLGPDMTEAGIRFYDKLLKKNIALRNITGNGTYTAMGNINYFIRNKSFPLTACKAFLEEKLTNEFKKVSVPPVNDMKME